MSARNRTRCTSLGKTVLTLNNHFRKTLFHLNNGGIPENCVLWINPCHGLYTVGMKYPVDIAFLNREGRVLKTLRNFPPNCFADPVPEAVSIIELPANKLAETRTGVGDLIEFDVA